MTITNRLNARSNSANVWEKPIDVGYLYSNGFRIGDFKRKPMPKLWIRILPEEYNALKRTGEVVNGEIVRVNDNPRTRFGSRTTNNTQSDSAKPQRKLSEREYYVCETPKVLIVNRSGIPLHKIVEDKLWCFVLVGNERNVPGYGGHLFVKVSILTAQSNLPTGNIPTYISPSITGILPKSRAIVPSLWNSVSR